MRSNYLFALCSGLLIFGTNACGDDSGSSEDDAATDTTDATDAEGTDATDATGTDEGTDTPTDGEATDQTTDSEATDTTTDSEATDSTGTDEGDAGPDETTDAGAGDGGAMEGDGGTMDAGDDAGEPEPELPEGACGGSPEDPENGAFVECDVTLNGETCELICETNYVSDGDATCTDGEWSMQTCVRLGSLTATIGDAQDGSDLADATVYVEGFYDPEVDDCAESAFCQQTNSMGEVRFDDFPSGEQHVVIVKEGYDEIALPIIVEPGSDETVHLDALPAGFLEGNIVVILSWESGGNLDLVLSVPTTAGECIHFDQRGSLTAEPFAQLDTDARTSSSTGPETIRISLNEAGDGPYYDGTYSVLVSATIGNRTLQGTGPSVRVIREGAAGAAEVELFSLPEDAVADATEWHVLDMEGDGTVTAVGTTEAPADKADSELVCITEL